MPESLLGRRFRLGYFLGIGLYVHWTFALIIAYVALVTSDTGAFGMAFAVGQLLGVFLCVTLHEYGHALAARQFGISTADITLLPIGGVARLKRVPRIPWQELVIAVAGPAVNVLIAAGLIGGFWVLSESDALLATVRYFVAASFAFPLDEQAAATVQDLFARPSATGFMLTMLIVNIMLVVFNMIPAFPMDGGRVFRSVLAMGLEYRRATRIAARVGLVCAILIGVIALTSEPPNVIAVMIALFVGYAGMAEARQVELLESVRGLTVGHVMVPARETLSMDLTLPEVIGRFRLTAAPALPVISSVGTVIGMLPLSAVQAAARGGAAAQTTAGQLLNHDHPTPGVQRSDPLESALLRGNRWQRQLPVVDAGGELQGILDLDTLVIRSELARLSSVAAPAPYRRFNQLSEP